MLGFILSTQKVYIFNKSYNWQYEVVYVPYLHPCFNNNYIDYNVAMFGLKIYTRFHITDLHECSIRVYRSLKVHFVNPDESVLLCCTLFIHVELQTNAPINVKPHLPQVGQ